MSERVGLFVTCLIDALRPAVGLAALSLLRDSGADVFYSKSQSCCGQIAFNSGARDEARRIVQKCMREFDNCDTIVVPSASCCGMFRLSTDELFSEAERAEIAAFQSRCLELSEYLQKVSYIPEKSEEKIITYHDSCTGLRELGIKSGPRELLRARGCRIIEMDECETCCGFGGTFSVKFGDVSAQIGEEKCRAIAASGAHAVVGGDVGCLLHIEGLLSRRGIDIPAYHWAQLLCAPDAPC